MGAVAGEVALLSVRLDEDDRYRAPKAQHEDATSHVGQEIAFRQAREPARKQARALRREFEMELELAARASALPVYR